MDAAIGCHVKRYGLGTGSESLESARSVSGPGIYWTIERVANGDKSRYVLKRFTQLVRRMDCPSNIWEIDPHRGYLITRVVSFGQDGLPGIVRWIEPYQIDHRWFPRSITEITYANWHATSKDALPVCELAERDSDGRVIVRRKTIHVDDAAFEKVLPASSFTIAGLGLSDGDRVAHLLDDGRVRTERYERGILIPTEEPKPLHHVPRPPR